MTFQFSSRSRANLNGVHPDLVRVATLALQRTAVDFSVIEGVRSLNRQRRLIATGASRLLQSRHLTGHAIDVAPWVPGVGQRWDWPLFLPIAEAMRTASIDTGIHIRWGGTWSLLWDLPPTITMDHRHDQFPDGAHFELPTAAYPT